MSAMSDWDEAVDEATTCLFCASSLPSADAAFTHMRTEHEFDFWAFTTDNKLNFYQRIKLINYIRFQVAHNACPRCEAEFQSR